MTIRELDRINLIKYRIEQAYKTFELAKELLAQGKLTITVNRIYYGMFYALTALALKHKFETSKHNQLIGWFNKEFINKKLVSEYYGRILRNAFKNRTAGDYDAFIEFEKANVEIMINEMKDFIEEINKLLNL